MNRARLSASIDADLLAVGRAAVAAGRAENLSAWVDQALRRQAEHDQRMTALDGFLAAYEDEHGEITATEIAEATRRTRARATISRGQPAVTKPAQRGRRSGVA